MTELSIEHGIAFEVPITWMSPRPEGSLTHGPDRSPGTLQLSQVDGHWGAMVVVRTGVPLLLRTDDDGGPYGRWGLPANVALFETAAEACAAAFETLQVNEPDPQGPTG